MKWAKIFDDHCAEIDATCTFVVKPILFKGSLFSAFGCDSNVMALLNFKATGNTKRFSEVQQEYAEYSDQWWNYLWEYSRPRDGLKLLWIDEFVMLKNYKLLFEDSDIVMKKSSRDKIFL